MVCHIGVQLGTKVVKSDLRMLAFYMYFNETGFLGGQTTMPLYEDFRVRQNHYPVYFNNSDHALRSK